MFVPTFNTLERLLSGVYGLIEQSSCVYIDEYYKWYELPVVARILRLDDETQQEINDLYLMELNDEIYISEEGVNFVLMYFDNLFKEDIAKLLSNDVMIDIKDYSMYMSENIKDKMLDMTTSINEDIVEDKDDKEVVKDCTGALYDYATDSKRPLRKRKYVRWSNIK